VISRRRTTISPARTSAAPSSRARRGCDGVTDRVQLHGGTDGELQANIKGLLSTTRELARSRHRAAGRVDLRHGQPAANDPAVRQLERDTAR
jgi:hypothetical protein